MSNGRIDRSHGQPRISEFHGDKEGKVDKKVQKGSTSVNKISLPLIAQSGKEISNPGEISVSDGHRLTQGAVTPHHRK